MYRQPTPHFSFLVLIMVGVYGDRTLTTSLTVTNLLSYTSYPIIRPRIM